MFLLLIGSLLGLYHIYHIAKREGFLEERVFDLLGILAFIFLFTGKISFIILNPRIYGYYNLGSIINSGFDVFVGALASFAVFYFFVTKHKKWSLGKLADVFAKGVSAFIAFALLWHFLKTSQSGLFAFITGLWFLFYFFLNFLEKNYLVGVSSLDFRPKRVSVLAGFRINLYAFLLFFFFSFLLIFADTKTPLWKIKVVLCFVFFFITIVRMAKESTKDDFYLKVKSLLFSKKKTIEEEEKKLIAEDPYFQKGRDVENAEEGDEVMDDLGHREVDMKMSLYKKIKVKIDRTLALINLGKYGKCEKCGGKIEEARLNANPFATTCVSCSSKAR